MSQKNTILADFEIWLETLFCPISSGIIFSLTFILFWAILKISFRACFPLGFCAVLKMSQNDPIWPEKLKNTVFGVVLTDS